MQLKEVVGFSKDGAKYINYLTTLNDFFVVGLSAII
jgi:hypothetical protein